MTWSPDLPAAGTYEIAVIAPANPNRATNVPALISIVGGTRTVEEHRVLVNEQNAAKQRRLSLGRFKLPAGKGTTVTVSNKDADGYVVVDGIQFLSVK